MPNLKVQQFYETEDEFHEMGDKLELDLTDEEIALIEENGGQPTWLDRHDGFFATLDDDE
ncbi:hypothetical protein [Burkholderia pyrrocinia]|uniref:hypothetical protein n=1 Tax=Burkholderia pyrrocinia TaxID=60550 RepID=UPI00158B01BE|nr:hypothetical protein [Burkholderia pyrrocinia]